MTKQPYQDKSKHLRSRSLARMSGAACCADSLAIGRRLGVIALVVSLQLLGSGCARQRRGSTPEPQPASTPEFTPITNELVGALRAGGARAAARLVGHYVGEIPFEDEDLAAEDVENLCRYSELAVLTKAVTRSPGSMQDGDFPASFIVTDYSMAVEESFHGHRAPGEMITVVMAGGFVQFSDGTTALERSRRGLPALRMGRRYVLFLQRDEWRPDLFRPFVREQGVFALDGGRVRPRGRDIDEVFKKYDGMKTADFLSLVRSACK